MSTGRDRLLELAQKLVAGEYRSDEELDRDMAEFVAGVPHPRASDLIFYWETEFDHEPTPEQIVERALNYRPIDL